MQIANGTTDKERPDNAKCKKLARAGAVRLKWPKDADFEEEEQYTWSILTEANWRKEAVLGWRYSAEELEKRATACDAAEPAAKRRK